MLMMIDGVSRLVLVSLITAAALFATPAFAIELTPGNWQDTETGIEDGKPVAPQVSTDCMTPEEARDPIKVLTAMKDQAGGQCERLEVKQNGNTVSFEMKCGDPKQMSMDIQATYTFVSAKHYTGTLKSTVILGGKKTTADKKVDSIWVGACNK
jgi:hypothetical protein